MQANYGKGKHHVSAHNNLGGYERLDAAANLPIAPGLHA